MVPGRYYVGDLCYVMSERWIEVCSLYDDNDYENGEYTLLDATQIAMYDTKYGDGTYKDQYNSKYSVDSGTIGCILVSSLANESLTGLKLGNIVEFPSEFSTSSNGGIIYIGHIVINTDEEYDDYEDYEDDEYENEDIQYLA